MATEATTATKSILICVWNGHTASIQTSTLFYRFYATQHKNARVLQLENFSNFPIKCWQPQKLKLLKQFRVNKSDFVFIGFFFQITNCLKLVSLFATLFFTFYFTFVNCFTKKIYMHWIPFRLNIAKSGRYRMFWFFSVSKYSTFYI